MVRGGEGGHEAGLGRLRGGKDRGESACCFCPATYLPATSTA